jgi:CheY-like chemotaxis protein
VATASNGNQVVALAEGSRFDLVLMDLEMPEMDGFEAFAEIRRREKTTGHSVPVVAITACEMKGERERCLEAGMDGYLAKPYGPEDLLAVVSRYRKRSGDKLTADR